MKFSPCLKSRNVVLSKQNYTIPLNQVNSVSYQIPVVPAEMKRDSNMSWLLAGKSSLSNNQCKENPCVNNFLNMDVKLYFPFGPETAVLTALSTRTPSMPMSTGPHKHNTTPPTKVLKGEFGPQKNTTPFCKE